MKTPWGTLTTVLCLLAITGMPGALAAEPQQITKTTTTITHDYLNLTTMEIWHYDASTGALTDTGTQATAPGGFACVSGTSAVMPISNVACYHNLLPCPTALCVDAAFFLAGGSQYSALHAELHSSTGGTCYADWDQGSGPNAFVAYHEESSWALDTVNMGCPHGFAVLLWQVNNNYGATSLNY